MWGVHKKKYRRLSPEVYYKDAQDALKNKKCYDAELLFRNMLSDFPGLICQMKRNLGWAKRFSVKKIYVTSIFEYERLLNEYPVSPYAAEARFQIGECYYQDARDIHHDQDETHKAIREFARFIEDYPESDFVSQAQGKIKTLRNQLALKEVMIAHDYVKWKYYTLGQSLCRRRIEGIPPILRQHWRHALSLHRSILRLGYSTMRSTHLRC